MAKGPQGQKRPADAIGCAVMVSKISTGEMPDNLKKPSGRTKSGLAGAAARFDSLSADERASISFKAANVRWGK